MNYIYLNVKHLREKNNYTKTKMADLIGKSSSLIGNYENDTALPPVPVLQKYAEVFGVSIGDLIDRDLTKENVIGPSRVEEPLVPYGGSDLLRRKKELVERELNLRLEEISVLSEAIMGNPAALSELESLDPELATRLKNLLNDTK